MTVIGITGVSGAGKSTLTRVFLRHGALVLDADLIYHRLLAESASLRDELVAFFGTGILTDGRVDRRKLAPVVFSSPEKLSELNRITHPHVIRRIMEALSSGKPALAVLDAPLLFESGLSGLCDLTVGVLAPREMRLERIIRRDGLSRKEAETRLDAQKPASFYIERCDHLLINDRSEEEFLARAESFWEAVSASDGRG